MDSMVLKIIQREKTGNKYRKILVVVFMRLTHYLLDKQGT